VVRAGARTRLGLEGVGGQVSVHPWARGEKPNFQQSREDQNSRGLRHFFLVVRMTTNYSPPF
jgi:hypothetical protein